MLRSFFLWGFVVVPLVVAIVLIVYRGRYFIITVAVLLLVMAGIWTALRLENSISTWWHGEGSPVPAICSDVPPGTALPEECTL